MKTPTLEIEFGLQQKTFQKFAKLNSSLACFVNCSSVRDKCVDQSVRIGCAQGLVSNSMITVALSFGTKNVARCFGIAEFLEANQNPMVTFTTEESGTGN